jgi:hypothetical protein
MMMRSGPCDDSSIRRISFEKGTNLDPYRPLIGKKHPAALGRGHRRGDSGGVGFPGTRFDSVMATGQETSQLAGQMFTVDRHNYLIDLFSMMAGSKDDADDRRIRSIPTAHPVSNERGTNFRQRFWTEVAAGTV